MRPHLLPLIAPLLIALVSACSKPPSQATAAGKPGSDPIGQDPTHPAAGMGDPGSRLMAMPSVVQNTDDPQFFVPLRSQQVKDAIYRALRSGQTQRWRDGKLSGYAVPSMTPGANGCRAVRYTVDQRPEVPFESINACSVSG